MKVIFTKWGDAWYFGPFIEWEPWRLRVGFSLGPLIWEVEFEGAFTKEARQKLKEERQVKHS